MSNKPLSRNNYLCDFENFLTSVLGIRSANGISSLNHQCKIAFNYVYGQRNKSRIRSKTSI